MFSQTGAGHAGRDRRPRILTDPFEFRVLQFAVRDYPALGGERQQDEKRSKHRQAHGRQTVPGLGHMVAITGASTGARAVVRWMSCCRGDNETGSVRRRRRRRRPGTGNNNNDGGGGGDNGYHDRARSP